MPTKRTYGIIGRPKKKERRDARVYTRLTDDELKKLVKIMDYKGFTVSEAIRFAINLAYDFIN